MKFSHLLTFLLCGILGQQAHAQATAWRPFRTGFVYGFSQASTASTSTHTLRADSAYATVAGDSVYTFNRLLRATPSNSYRYLKSRNNLFGARQRWRPGTSDYYLEANAEPALGGSATPITLLLKPRAALGSPWAASTAPVLSATLSSRTLGTIGNAPDSLATITLSNGQKLVISRSYGLVEGPVWLALDATPSSSWQQRILPQAGLGGYAPQTLFALNVGDELGYELLDVPMFSPSCYSGYRLRRISLRQQTADSLVIGYLEQDRIVNSGWCGVASTVLSAVKQQRWAFSLQTGISPQFPYLALLTGEYRTLSASNPTALYMGQGYQTLTNAGACFANTQALPFLVMYGTSFYSPGIDLSYRSYTFSASLGTGPLNFTAGDVSSLAYYRRGSITCGQAATYASLLPTRVALAAAAGTLHPNPAIDNAALTLAAATLPGTYLTLTDALGQRVWSASVPAGYTVLAVPLADQPAGVYSVQLLAPATAPLTWKLAKH